MRLESREEPGSRVSGEIPAAPSIDLSAERRMWTAVLMQAFEEWRSNNVRARAAAEKFLFEEKEDFATVCLGAGLNPESLRSRLSRMRRKAVEPNLPGRPLAA